VKKYLQENVSQKLKTLVQMQTTVQKIWKGGVAVLTWIMDVGGNPNINAIKLCLISWIFSISVPESKFKWH